jgi:outer membrane protein TolC
VRAAFTGRADFRSLQSQSLAADERVEGARALRLPTVQAFGSLQDMGLVKTDLERVFEVGVQVKVPLFTGGRIQAQENLARAARSQLEAARREQEAKVASEVRVARERLDTARSEVTLSEGVLRLSQAELEQARHRFEAGVSSNIELVNAQEELARAQEGNLDACYRLDQAQADLAHARGELETRYAL